MMSSTSPAGGPAAAVELGAQGPAPGGFALGADHDQPLEQAPHALAGGVVERAVQLLGPRRDGGVDAAQLR